MNDSAVPVSDSTYHESKLLDLVQDHWGAILGGALAGFGATVMMALLGSALGLSVTAGAIAARTNEADPVATGLGVGALVWMVVSAIAVGVVAGRVMRKLSGPRSTYNPTLFGILNWAVGLTLAVGVASVSGAGVAAGLGGAGGGAAAAISPHADRVARAFEHATPGTDGERGDAAATSTTLTPDERARAAAAAESAAKMATILAWTGFIAVLIGLFATIFAAHPAGSLKVNRTAQPRAAGSPA